MKKIEELADQRIISASKLAARLCPLAEDHKPEMTAPGGGIPPSSTAIFSISPLHPRRGSLTQYAQTTIGPDLSNIHAAEREKLP